MRLFVLTLSLIAGLVGTSQAQAQSSRNLESRVERLERRVIDQERAIDDLYERIDRMDRRGPRKPFPQPPVRVTHNCLIVDSGFSKTFLGSGSTMLDAEFAAKESCQKSTHASYCNVNARCDVSGQGGSIGAVCVVVDSGFSKSYRGEGSSEIAAEAAAKSACQAGTHASYCNVKPRCELKY